MDADSFLDSLGLDAGIAEHFVVRHTEPARAAHYHDFPVGIAPALRQMLEMKGIARLYSHQAEAFAAIMAGHHVIVTTGVASGKSLCYQLPLLQRLIENPAQRALLLFPTRALAQDQKEAAVTLLRDLAGLDGNAAKASAGIYDGDTPANIRQQIRRSANLLFSNPDMLHLGILPHHTAWADFFRNLGLVVIDEVHTYRGVFGSHCANILRRFKRIAAHYGSYPQFLLTSATLANVRDFIPRLIEADGVFITEDGSPRGERHFYIYNPPLANPEFGIRQSPLLEAVRIGQKIFKTGGQTLLFAPSRKMVELAVTYLQRAHPGSRAIQGYRSGYLARERRQIEQSFRSGAIRLLCATNAMELGVDIGGLDTVIITGYPGSIASTRQQSGRAGRHGRPALTILVASANPIDQYLVRHPDYLFGRTPEEARINPDNPLLLMKHLECALFEKTFRADEPFGQLPMAKLQQYFAILEKHGRVHRSAGNYYWKSSAYPAEAVSLRSASAEEYLLRCDGQTIGLVDSGSAFRLVHPEAIYLHNGETYFVRQLDLEKRLAELVPLQADYYTQVKSRTSFEILVEEKSTSHPAGSIHFGQIKVSDQVTGFKKMRWFSAEILGHGELELPAVILPTMGYWFRFSEEEIARLEAKGLWNNTANDYGPDWPQIRQKIRERDRFTCQNCRAIEPGAPFDVHHRIPFKTFSSPALANRPDNLVTLCPSCHRLAEKRVRIQSGLSGLAHLLRHIAPLYLMCDQADIGASIEPSPSDNPARPIIMIYDSIAGGIGLAEKLYTIHDQLLRATYDIVERCPCPQGCPACVGPVAEEGQGAKELVRGILQSILSSAR
jgi:DEAD/DEAH box helicase domain-containing protein